MIPSWENWFLYSFVHLVPVYTKFWIAWHPVDLAESAVSNQVGSLESAKPDVRVLREDDNKAKQTG